MREYATPEELQSSVEFAAFRCCCLMHTALLHTLLYAYYKKKVNKIGCDKNSSDTKGKARKSKNEKVTEFFLHTSLFLATVAFGIASRKLQDNR